ncbi:MAG: dioxygenase [Micrococcales bacterium]
MTLPALYLSHGAPMLLDDELWMSELAQWSKDLPKPKGILIISAHWENAPITISSTDAKTPLIYDFGGFAPKFYQMTYETPDAAWLGELVSKCMPATEPLHYSPNRGLDHGAWVPLRAMYPEHDIPVIQLSMPTRDPQKLMEIGRRLRPLRDEGVLIIGSGFMTHGLPYLRDWRPDAAAPGWSREFDFWVNEALQHGDIESLINYQHLAPGVQYAHPTVEHFTPLFITMGASVDPEQQPDNIIEGYFMGLSKRSFEVK